MANARSQLQKIPQVDKLLRDEKVSKLIIKYGRQITLEIIRSTIDALKKSADTIPDYDSLIERIGEYLKKWELHSYSRVVNATGVVLHTGLGRAPYAEKIAERVKKNLTRYSLLEISPHTGNRIKRETHIEALLKIWTGVEAGLVVNNNAAATFIILNTFARGKNVLVARSHLVEIGGSYRLPDILQASGAILKEVGTTNRTYVDDFEKAIDSNTGLLLYVHKSNFIQKGYIKEITMKELAGLSSKTKIPFVIDLGSGAPFILDGLSQHHETTIVESINSGAIVSCFSADKLLGSCQGGVILGKKDAIEKIRKNPIYRAVRPDKFTLLALEETIKIYLNGNPKEEIPIYKMIYQTDESLKSKADRLKEGLSKIKGLKVLLKDEFSEIGGGSLPEAKLKTFLIAISSDKLSEERIAGELRANNPPIFSRIIDGQVSFDVRTIFEDDIEVIEKAVKFIIRHD
ncbi:MAG: L-seryl-tRNA(Sec) selenium transferase [Planctomycetes bacterium]|nr:L-seryl-tRNA(Sec) selenium transferase [Planctomycetota bacterium]